VSIYSIAGDNTTVLNELESTELDSEQVEDPRVVRSPAMEYAVDGLLTFLYQQGSVTTSVPIQIAARVHPTEHPRVRTGACQA
jgi:hypothetical protein